MNEPSLLGAVSRSPANILKVPAIHRSTNEGTHTWNNRQCLSLGDVDAELLCKVLRADDSEFLDDARLHCPSLEDLPSLLGDGDLDEPQARQGRICLFDRVCL